ncbi:MAG: type II secretion system F family protein [Acidimicrobiia bacterium]|nr:type II secretion system F family protein [Acidimicrobiia bacterium]
MRRIAALLGVLVALAPAAMGGASEDLEIVEVDTGALPLVAITVEVPSGLAGVELPAEAFTLVEDGFAVAAGVWTSRQEPLDVVLVIDTSGSMSGRPLEDALAAAAGFVDRLPEGARVGFVSSGDPAEVRHAIDDDRQAALADLEGLAAGGETALYDAVLLAIGTLRPDEARSVIVVLSDGGDTVSAASLGDVVDVLSSAGVETSVIALETDETDSTALAAMAASGGGDLIPVADAGLLGEAFLGIADDLGRRYRLVYRTVASGDVEVIVGVSHGGITAVGRAEVPLPSSTGVPATTAAPVPEQIRVTGGGAPEAFVHPAPKLLESPWAMPAGVGAAVVGGAALMALVMTSRRRAPGSIPVERPVTRRGLLSRLTNRAEGVADRVLKSRGPGRLERDLDRAGIALRPSEFLLLSVSLGVVAIAGSLLVVGAPVALAVAALAVASPRVVLRVLTARRRAAFADQFDGTLQMLSGSLRAGYGLMQSVATVAEEATAPTGAEFSRVSVENQLGRTVEESLRSMSARMDNEDLRWVVEAIDIQYEVGGDLAEVLDTVAETIRDRDQIRRQVRALSAEGRISAVILISMPFAIAFLISMVSPEYLADLTGTSIGRVMIGVALVMIGIGAAWIKRIVKVVF